MPKGGPFQHCLFKIKAINGGSFHSNYHKCIKCRLRSGVFVLLRVLNALSQSAVATVALVRHHSDNILRIRCSFSRSNPNTVSISIPRKVRTEAGPSTLWCATGTPKAAHVASALAKLSAHSWESGRPKTENRPGSGCPK